MSNELDFLHPGFSCANMFGLKIVVNPFATRNWEEFKVERWPTKKKRRNWRVVKYTINEPTVFKVGNTLYVHPSILERLK